MRTLKALVVAALLFGLLTPSFVQAAPIPGFYLPAEVGGAVIDGRWSEAWAGGSEGAVGSTVSAASWDGAALGTQWEISGPAIVDVDLVGDAPTGIGWETVEYFTTYSGGSLKLKNTGAWWNAGDPGTEYDLVVTSYTHDTMRDLYNGQFVTATTIVHLTADFVGYPGYSVDFLVSVAMPTGMGATPPLNYPEFAIDTTAGAWGVAQKIRMNIIPEPATLAVLGLGGLLLRRRLA